MNLTYTVTILKVIKVKQQDKSNNILSPPFHVALLLQRLVKHHPGWDGLVGRGVFCQQ